VREWIDLLTKPSLVAIVVLAILGALYLVRLVLDFVKSTVLPRAYEHHLQKRKLILPLADKVLDASAHTAIYFRDGDPKFVDFKQGCIFPRPELAAVRTILQKNRFVHIQGPPSSGKTVIALNLAYEWLRAKHVVLYFDRPSLLVDDFLEYLATPAAARFLDRQGTVLVVDDVHLDVARTSRLFSFIYANFTKLSLVFVSRPLTGFDLETDNSAYYNFARFAEHVDVQADTVIAQLADFYSVKRFGHPVPRPILKAFMEECGSDLLILGRYLKEWTGSSLVNLPEIRKKVFHTIREDLEQLRSISPDAVAALFVVSLFYRFEVPVERAFLETEFGLQIESLVKRGDLKEQNAFILLHHSSLAKLYSNVCRSLAMPEYAEVVSRYAPLPEALFRAYVRSEPRNLCEFLIGVRRNRGTIAHLLGQPELHEHIRKSLERERDPKLLGWAMLVIHAADHRKGWMVLKDVDFGLTNRELISTSSPGEISLFFYNLSKVSQTKGEEYLQFVPVTSLARAIESMGLGRAAGTLEHVARFSSVYFKQLAAALDPNAICNQVLREDSVDVLRAGVRRLSKLMGARVCIKVSNTEDAFGEPISKLSFYFDTVRVTRFLSGRRLDIPYGEALGMLRITVCA
jgi:RecA/RadA recombinase